MSTRTTSRDLSSRLPARFRAWRKRHWLVCGTAAAMLVGILGILPGMALAKRDAATELVLPLELPPPVDRIDLDVAHLAAEEAASLATSGEGEGWHRVEVASGDTLGRIYQGLGFGANHLQHSLSSEHVRELASRLQPGSELAFYAPTPGQLEKILFDKGESSRILVHLDGEQARDEILERHLQHRVERATGEIRSSLFGAASDAGLSNIMVMKIAKVLGYDIDFAQDLRVGDSFAVIYEQIYRDGELIRDGDVLAVSFVNRGRRVLALRHVHADGKVEYFDQDGRPMRRDFLRTPVDFTRISSRFSLARRHPILGRTRAHQGVDYAAPTGTPIYAAGSGRVQFRGRQGGYGNTIILDHGSQTTTLYAHMSRFHPSVRQGGRVQQGEVIGYVGATGLATGPHLHYEFRVKGSHRDPLTVTLPKPEPLKGNSLDRFRRETTGIAAQLDLMESNRTLAAN